jgi:hypothetical protein
VDRGTARLLIVVALAVVGGFVLANGFDSSAVPSPDVTPETSPTPSTSTSTPGGTQTQEPDTVEPQDPADVEFMALNGTSVDGCGAVAQEEMEGVGYVVAADADNAPVQGAEATSVLYRVGETDEATAQNEANAKQIAKKVFKGAKQGELSNDYDDLVPQAATIVILVGLDFAEESCS